MASHFHQSLICVSRIIMMNDLGILKYKDQFDYIVEQQQNKLKIKRQTLINKVKNHSILTNLVEGSAMQRISCDYFEMNRRKLKKKYISQNVYQSSAIKITLELANIMLRRN
ncbi:unnamed protein product [Paramecium octaurelia]|uniref:Uncharacterized protein n=1 Tax=Paramecium octaurelia TaxID=43137 RepID=A0A8S1YGA1_PAROT|nr:unnamed protein product [Paramecium octaurelia]